MKENLCRFLVSVLFVSLNAPFSAAESRCGGGEGPSPLVDVSGALQTEVRLVPSEGGIKEFLYWERRNKIIYRNESNQVQATSVGGIPHGFTSSGLKLARVLDRQERMLATQHDTWVTDTAQGGWWRYGVPTRPVDPLFWHNHRSWLYSLNSKLDEAGNQTIKIYKYQMGNSTASVACTLRAKAGEIYQIAQGHSFPEAYFYRVKRQGERHLITLYGLDVRWCRLFGMDQYTRPLVGPARGVHVFHNLKSILVDVDHETHNLLWDSPDGCRYFNTRQLRPLVPNHSVPVVVTWSRELGMSLIFLNHRKKAKVSQSVQSVSFASIENLQQKDLWFTRDAKRLFLSPLFESGQPRWLLELKLGPIDY